MTRTKTWVALLLALSLAIGQVSFAQSAPLQQTSTTDVTVTNVTPITDPQGNVTGYIVDYTDTANGTHTVVLTLAEAVAWGLVTLDPTTGDPIVATLPITLTIDSASADPCASGGTGQPVGEALAGVFCGSQGVSYDTIMSWQTGGYGFGVIGQALFMAQLLGGDPTLAAAILAAKKSGDYSALANFGVPASITNWGQLKKYIMSVELRSMTNLGAIMSGRQGPFPIPTTSAPTTTTTTVTTDTSNNPGNGKGKAKGQNGGGNGKNGNGNGNGNGNNGNGKANGKNKGN